MLFRSLLFGSNVSTYSNLARSLMMLLERLLGNNMYTNELKAANQIMAQLFTVAYSLSIAMILMNMFLSILHSSYREIRLLKQGRFPDVELARFAAHYFMEKVKILWHDTKHSIKETKLRKLRFNRRKADVFGFLKRDSKINREAEEYICLSSENVRFEEVVLEEMIDIDSVDEYNSLKDMRKTILQIGGNFFLTQNEWSSSSINEEDDDREDASSSKGDWSDGMESSFSNTSDMDLV